MLIFSDTGRPHMFLLVMKCMETSGLI